MSEGCSICGGATEYQFTAEILHCHQVEYFQCKQCGLLQTEKPYWLEEAYDNAIAKTDTGLVRRNLSISKRLTSVLYFLINCKGKFVDAAGGHGLLTRIMRDIGFDFYWSDKHCANILARGFEANEAEAPFTAVTAFEVMEHVHDPLGFVRDLLNRLQTGTIIFSTTLFEGAPPQPGQWWYYALETGQHISFYQRRTLHAMADALGLRLFTHGWMHMLTDRAIHPLAFSLLTGRLGMVLSYFVKTNMVSKTFSDHALLSNSTRLSRD